jgi:hypothetical protein
MNIKEDNTINNGGIDTKIIKVREVSPSSNPRLVSKLHEGGSVEQEEHSLGTKELDSANQIQISGITPIDHVVEITQ